MSSMVASCLGWAGALLVVIGYYLNANHVEECWLVWIVGNVLVGAYSLHKNANSTAAMSFMLALINVYGYYMWKG